jgi:hypothetical protein
MMAALISWTRSSDQVAPRSAARTATFIASL